MIQNMEYYYFAEILQADGDWIVTSPIWYKNTSPTPIDIGFEEFNKDFEFNFFPNPVNQNLNISMSNCDDYKISVIDISGRKVLEKSFYDQYINLDLSNISQGVYTVEIKTKSISKFKKLVVE